MSSKQSAYAKVLTLIRGIESNKSNFSKFCRGSDYITGLKIRLESGLEPVPLQLEHVATNRSRNQHSTHLGEWP